MIESKVKYKKVDSLVHGEVKEIELIGYNSEIENEKYYFVFWRNHNDEARSTNVSHKELFEWFKIDNLNNFQLNGFLQYILSNKVNRLYHVHLLNHQFPDQHIDMFGV